MWSLYCDLSATLWKWSSELLILRTNIADKHSTIMGTGIVQVVTLMEPVPLGGGIRKRMDFQVKSKSPNLGARRVILMMWLMPLGSGPAVSPTIMIIMRILISCPW